MQSFLSGVKGCVIVCIVVAMGFVVGCKDNPERAAKKAARAAVEAAMREYSSSGDFDKAQKALNQALADSSGDAGGEEAVMLAEGVFNYGKASKMQAELGPLWTSIDGNLDELAKFSGQIGQMKLEKMEIETVLRSRQEERRQLGIQLDGEAGGQGLTAKLKAAQDKLAELKSQQSKLDQELSEKLKQATEIQRQADELLAKAELAKGAEKAQLQKQAYDVILGTAETAGKNAYLGEAQELQDQLSVVVSEIALAEPQAAMFSAQIDKVKKRIDELDKSDFAAKSDARLAEIGTALAQFQQEFSGVLSQVEQTQSGAAEKVKQITDMLSSAQKNFKRVTSDEALRDFSRVAGAEALLCAGKIGGDYALSQRLLAARLSILASGEAMESQAQLKTLSQQYVDESDGSVTKAITDYNDAANLYGRIPARKTDEFSVAVLKNHILALAQMAYLAERVENMEARAAAVEQAKELIEKAVDFDPAFGASFGTAPYSILTDGKIPVSAEKAAAVAEVNTAEPMAAVDANLTAEEPNQPVVEPNEATDEPNEAMAEPNEAVEEANEPMEEPNVPAEEPNQG